MNLKYRARRWIKRRLGSALDSSLAPRMLGFRRQTPGIVRDVAAGLQVSYDKNSVIGDKLFYFGGFETAEIAFVSARLQRQRNPVVLDVGANIGWHTINWARAAPGATFFAFEPSPTVADLLRRNVAMNGFEDRVHIVEVAVGDCVGRAQFFECSDSAYSSLKDTGRSPVRQKVDVACTTIDDFVRDHDVVPDLIKVDVEGLEHDVLMGARECLSMKHPDLLVEIFQGDKSNADPEATVKLLLDLGYSAFNFVEGRPQPHVRHTDDQYNYFFCRGAL